MMKMQKHRKNRKGFGITLITSKRQFESRSLRSESRLVDNTKYKADILKQYHSVFTPENEHEQLPQLNDNYPSIQDIHVTVNGIEKSLHNLDPSKATGPNEIPARILKQYATEFAPHVAHIFNNSLAQGDVSTDWRQANVIHIFKKRGKVFGK